MAANHELIIMFLCGFNLGVSIVLGIVKIIDK